MVSNRVKENIFLKNSILILTMILFAGCTIKNQEAEKITIRFQTPESLFSQQKIVKDIIKEFEEVNPNIEVRFDFSPDTKKVLVEIAGGTAPDVFYRTVGDLPGFIEKGALLDIAPFIKQRDVSLEEYYPQTVEAFSYDNKIYGFPLHFSTGVLFYNKTLFDKAGIAYPGKDWVWNGFLESARRLTKDTDGDGITDQFGCVQPDWGGCIMSTNGTRNFNNDITRCTVNTPEMVESLEFLLSLKNIYRVVPTEGLVHKEVGTGFDATSLFMTGRLGMLEGATWMVTQFKDIKDFAWDVSIFPKAKKGFASYLGIGGLCISTQTKYPKEAFEFVKFYCGNRGSEILANEKNCVPALKQVAEKVFAVPPPEHIHLFMDVVKYTEPAPKLRVANEIGEKVFHPEIELILLGKQKIQKGLEIMEKKANQMLKEFWAGK